MYKMVAKTPFAINTVPGGNNDLCLNACSMSSLAGLC